MKKHVENEEKIEKALLISVYKNSALKDVCIEHLLELELLVETFGIQTVSKQPCFLRKYEASTCIGSGKIEEYLKLADELEADYVIFDDEITPGQQRNLEKAFGRSVIDRTEVILGVFAQRARTKEARLQIELAQVKYQAPRLKRLWTHLSRQAGTSGSGGAGGYTKGEGEKQIEIDRRLLQRDIEKLQDEIKEVRAIRETQRASRVKAGIPIFAIIGYTNAGKSTLLNALTDADVFVEDKLFATLDTTTRKFELVNNQEILLIDTVGFIRKLPHLLVAAFKSTLEEAFQADILLHIIDVSHHMAEEQAAATHEVLKELDVGNKTIITVLNKIDKCEDPEMITRLKLLYPHTVEISALKKIGFEALQDMMILELSKRRKIVTLQIPQSAYGAVSELMKVGHIISTDYLDNDVILKVEIPISLTNKFEKYAVSERLTEN